MQYFFIEFYHSLTPKQLSRIVVFDDRLHAQLHGKERRLLNNNAKYISRYCP